jgi:hypothetical protein
MTAHPVLATNLTVMALLVSVKGEKLVPSGNQMPETDSPRRAQGTSSAVPATPFAPRAFARARSAAENSPSSKAYRRAQTARPDNAELSLRSLAHEVAQ